MMGHESNTYRRGLTLGLTMAEIFILILFLLLLMLLVLYALNDETKKKLQEVEQQLKQIETELAKTKIDRDNARNFLPENIQVLIRDNESLTQKLNDTELTIETLTTKLSKAELTIKALTAKLSKSKDESGDKDKDIDKGIDPPCWYEVTTRKGERHEKPYYLMDVAVYNEHLEIRGRQAPPGHAVDESGQRATTSYQEEYEELSLLLPSGKIKKVSLQQFTKMTEPIKRMGKNKNIRDYACVFYVKVWDLTSATAKTRWKKAEDAIKGSFYTYRVKNDPW